MKIVIDAREWSTSSGRYISSLVRNLELIDHRHHYTILLYPKDLATYEPANPRFTKLACPHKEFTFDEQLGFKKQLDDLGADLVHFDMVQQPVLYRGKVVTTINDLTTLRFGNPSKNSLLFWAKQRVYAWVNKRVACKSDAILTFTEFVKQDVTDYTGISPDKITAIHLAGDPITEASEPLNHLEDKRFIMYVGRPTPHKNLERLIAAFQQLNQPNLYLVLAGKKDANYRRIEAKTDSQNIVFTDFITDGQLRWLYENCQAYVFPSLSEGFGLPGLEAMAHGAPVISSNATCLPEVYGDAAHYFDPTDVNAMAAAIGHVLSDETLRKEMIKKGYAQVKKYSWKKTAEQTLAVYEKVLDS
jgi:glycosyltransferase involved in cell wall biosynthesis